MTSEAEDLLIPGLMVGVRKVIITVEAHTLLKHEELKQLRGLVFGQLKGGERRTIKAEKPIGTQHDCWGLIEQVQVNVVGPSDQEIEEPHGHPRRKDWKKPKAKKRAKPKAARRKPKAKPVKEKPVRTKKAPRKPRPSDLKRKEARAAARAAKLAAATPPVETAAAS